MLMGDAENRFTHDTYDRESFLSHIIAFEANISHSQSTELWTKYLVFVNENIGMADF